ncbi:hypothetical protein EXE58_10880 [Nocardioides seonyuensis]|uniref:NifU family protein n=1 Tax=Nocardioides seonyuensis TaxID=2518371 RepID=A0A4P7IF75_9ACTN|nr:hypothetical protein [Nocardioides seonyuensis]QBX55915.1 hypothetical protein EXE58_10880 [Nocardioides seonyuensis]
MTTVHEALSRPVIEVIDELAGMISIDGGRLELREASPDRLRFDLVLQDAECAECVMPRAYLEGILTTRLAQVSSSPPEVQISDPREPAE